MSKVIKGSAQPTPSSRPFSSASAKDGRSNALGLGGLRSEKRPIIERERVDAKEDARRIVLEADEQARAIVEAAEAEAHAIREAAREEGYQEGLGQMTEETTRRLLAIEALKAEIEPAYVALVTTCVSKIIGEELRTHPDAVVSLVKNALKDATQQREITVRVNPTDGDLLRKNERRLLDVLARANCIEVRDDPLIERGGCVVVTELGTIDASLERQLLALSTAIDEEAKAGPSSSAGDDEPDEADATAGASDDEDDEDLDA